jgi:hypothetical protein
LGGVLGRGRHADPLVNQIAASVPAVIAGLAVTRYGLRDTATVYAAVVIALALAAAVATKLTLSASSRGTPAATATGDADPIRSPRRAQQ